MPTRAKKTADAGDASTRGLGRKPRTRTKDAAAQGPQEMGAAVRDSLSSSLGPVISEYVQRALEAVRTPLDEFEDSMARVVRQEMSRELHLGGETPQPTTASHGGEDSDLPPDTVRETRTPVQPPTNTRGGVQMATDTQQKKQTESRSDANQRGQSSGDQGAIQDQEQPQASQTDSSGTSAQAPARRGSPGEVASAGSEQARYVYNPSGAVQAALLRLASSWRDAGSVHQAMAAYTEILARYPGSGAAQAATEDMVELAKSMEQAGMFYTALAILRKVEALV